MTAAETTGTEEAREGFGASPNRTALERFLRHPTAMASTAVLVLLGLVTILAPVIAPGDPMRVNPVARFTAPGAEYFFGTDNLGRDVFRIVVHGGRTSLLVGLVVTVVSVSIATVLGLVSGFFHQVDIVLMRFVDGIMAFPSIVLATAAAAYLGASVSTVILALSFVLIAPSLRVVRGQVLVVRELQMIEAARATGVPTLRIFRRYVLPAVTSPILVQASFIFSAAVLGEAALSFIGVGIGPTDLSWGNALTEARDYIGRAPWIVIFPGLALMITILALNLLGDSLRDILDPRLARRR
ncbi:ABC transporter permease [Psychromarinibacter sp. C21-152]|uniref:ABC transporter permease n=1 Tax=Psychromarinibacter sediminicola TaxID=3033385 RepID=A0AAE3NT50_9RHOB|nr:ABC transporter permease [Psychromarinibacter sediminicola]MDF0603058.1 ABC transporter permease [Psychromarinibacter sediminicola]